jgi:hypothetical protein
VSWMMKKRIHQIELFIKYPHDVQMECFRKLITTAKATEWGKTYDYDSINTVSQFRERVPLSFYEGLKPFITRIRNGEQNVLWPSPIHHFAKSSGTTDSKSKYIPVSREALEECHYKGGKDLLSIYCNNNPETEIFDGKFLGLGGSRAHDDSREDTFHGDVSAILMNNLPFWIEIMRTPSITIALMDEWESKIEKMAYATKDEDVTSISGVPSWSLLLCKRVLEITGKKNLGEVWPRLELFVHGGVSFAPYREQYKKIMPPGMLYMDTYNASEGFFGIQDSFASEELLLMLDYGIYYEFIPMDYLNEPHPTVYGLDEVHMGINYAMVITTNAGLWRYIIGDTVTFTSLNPFRIRITGRTKNFINAFGEELIIDNAEKALTIACEKTNASIRDYTAAPIFLNDHENAAHEWAIEFDQAPENLDYFGEVLDNALKSLNSDYEAKRYHNLILKQPIIHAMAENTFYNWLKKNHKLGGQYKVPRLSNNRIYIDQILNL